MLYVHVNVLLVHYIICCIWMIYSSLHAVHTTLHDEWVIYMFSTLLADKSPQNRDYEFTGTIQEVSRLSLLLLKLCFVCIVDV